MSMGRATLTRAPIQELYNPALESVASLDDLQRSWETLKNVVHWSFMFNNQMTAVFKIWSLTFDYPYVCR